MRGGRTRHCSHSLGHLASRAPGEFTFHPRSEVPQDTFLGIVCDGLYMTSIRKGSASSSDKFTLDLDVMQWTFVFLRSALVYASYPYSKLLFS